MPAEVKVDHAGIGELLVSGEIRSFITSRAERVLAAAQASAPVATGAYKASLHISQDTTDRVAVRVAAGVDYALEVEAATGNLARAIDAAGGS